MTESSNAPFLEDERKKDPMERLVSLLEKVFGGMGKAIGALPPPPPLEPGTLDVDPRALRPLPRPARAIYSGPQAQELNIRKIANGYLLCVSSPFQFRTTETYCPDKEALAKEIATAVAVFVQAAEGPVPPIHGVDAFQDDTATVGS